MDKHRYTRGCECEACAGKLEQMRAMAMAGREANARKARMRREAGGCGGKRKREREKKAGKPAAGAEKAPTVPGRTVKERLEAVQEELLKELEARVTAAKLGAMDVDELEKLLKGVREGLAADAALEYQDVGRAIQVVSGMSFEEEGDEVGGVVQ